jgi:hypothetical protein
VGDKAGHYSLHCGLHSSNFWKPFPVILQGAHGECSHIHAAFASEAATGPIQSGVPCAVSLRGFSALPVLLVDIPVRCPHHLRAAAGGSLRNPPLRLLLTHTSAGNSPPFVNPGLKRTWTNAILK